MRAIVLFAASAGLFWGVPDVPAGPQKDEKKDTKDAKEPAKSTPAAELTRAKSLKAKMTVAFTDARLGDVLKEFAAQVDMRVETQLMWTYGPNFPYAQKVTYSCKDKALDAALDELFKKVGELGYVVVSKDGDKHDGWVLLTTTGERGFAKPLPPPANAAAEADAAEKLGLAKKLIEAGKNEPAKIDQAKTVLSFILKRYPTTKAAPEAKELLGKLEK